MKGLAIFIALACVLHSTYGQWTMTTPELRALPISGMAGDSKGNILVVQESGYVTYATWSSDNGASWKPGFVPALNQYYYPNVYCIDDVFYITTPTYLLTATGGQNFTATQITTYVSSSSPQVITTQSGGILFGGMDYNYSHFEVSTDGINFKGHPLPAVRYITQIYAAGPVFILMAYPTPLISSDGINWSNFSTSEIFGAYQNINFVTGEDNTIVAGVSFYGFSGEYSAFYVSADEGATWTVKNANLTGELYSYAHSFVYAMGYYFINIYNYNNLGSPYSIQASKDLITWTVLPGNSYPYVPYFYGVGTAVMAWYPNNTLAISTTALSFTTLNTGFYGYWGDVYTLADGTYVLQTTYNQFYSTSDGYTFTALPASPFPANLFGSFETFSAWEQSGTFYFFERNGTLFTTTDFNSWTTTQIDFGDSFYTASSLINGNNVWVGIADVYNLADQRNYAFVMQTTDLTSGTWTIALKSKPFSSSNFYSIAFGNGIFTLQLGGSIYTSKDGLTWVQPNSKFTTLYYTDLFFVGDLFFLTSSQGYYSVSPNASVWQVLPTWNYGNPQYDPISQTYYAFYTYGYISTSSDGVHWAADTALSFPSTNGFSVYLSVLGFNGKFWLAGDTTGSVYVHTN